MRKESKEEEIHEKRKFTRRGIFTRRGFVRKDEINEEKV